MGWSLSLCSGRGRGVLNAGGLGLYPCIVVVVMVSLEDRWACSISWNSGRCRGDRVLKTGGHACCTSGEGGGRGTGTKLDLKNTQM